ncbi:MAG: hypothetical protein ACRDOI_28850, partial [Trebonia sp.]
HGSLSDVLIDGVGLITFGIGKGLIGGAEATAEVSEAVANAYQGVMREGDGSVATFIKAGDKAFESLKAGDDWSASAKFLEKMQETISVRPVFTDALKAAKAWQGETVGKVLGDNPLGKLGGGLRDALMMKSPEIGSALANTAHAAAEMDGAKGVGWALDTRVQVYGNLFSVTQGLGIGTDMAGRLDTGLNHLGVKVPGYDSIKDWPQQAGS